MKLSISLDDALLERLDKAADLSYQTRSGYIGTAVSQYLNQQEVIFALRDLVILLRQIYDTGKLDEDATQKLKQLEAVLALCK